MRPGGTGGSVNAVRAIDWMGAMALALGAAVPATAQPVEEPAPLIWGRRAPVVPVDVLALTPGQRLTVDLRLDREERIARGLLTMGTLGLPLLLTGAFSFVAGGFGGNDVQTRVGIGLMIAGALAHVTAPIALLVRAQSLARALRQRGLRVPRGQMLLSILFQSPFLPASPLGAGYAFAYHRRATRRMRGLIHVRVHDAPRAW